jgi:hypothetical protein
VGVQPDFYVVQFKAGSNMMTIHVGPDLTYDSGDVLHFSWPLSTGATWTYKVTHTINGKDVSYQGTSTAAAAESVTVPAGTFDAVRINSHHCNQNSGKCGDFTLWYVPKAKYAVKIVHAKNSYWGSGTGLTLELVSYTVHDQ